MAFGISAADVADIKKELEERNELATPTIEQNPTFVAGDRNDPKMGKWSEVVVIRDTKLGAPSKDPSSTTKHVFQIKVEVQREAEGGVDAPNGGRVFNYVIYIDEADLADAKKAWQVRSKLGVVNSLLTAVGVDITQGIADYEEYFEREKPLIGAKVLTAWSKRKYVSKGIEGQNFECTGFFSMEAVN